MLHGFNLRHFISKEDQAKYDNRKSISAGMSKEEVAKVMEENEIRDKEWDANHPSILEQALSVAAFIAEDIENNNRERDNGILD
jgi:hypothetical protein